MTTFFLVRHGVTAETGHRLTGWTEGVALNDEGRAQAAAAGAFLSSVKLRAIYTSPVQRCSETARIVAESHPRLQPQELMEIGEVRFGTWSGSSFKALRRRRLWETVQRWPSLARFPEGESFTEVQARAVAGLDALRAEHPRGAICCVSHADVIKLIVAHYLGMHIDLFQRIVIGPASVSVVTVGEHGPRVSAVNLQPEGSPG